MFWSEALYQYLPGGTYENHEKPLEDSWCYGPDSTMAFAWRVENLSGWNLILRSPEYIGNVLTTTLWCLWNACIKTGMHECTYLWFVWGFFKILLWFLASDTSFFHRNTLDLVTPNFLLEVHIRALLNTSGSFSAIESQCVMKHRGKEFVVMLTVMQLPKRFP